MFTEGAFKVEMVDHVWIGPGMSDPRLVKLVVQQVIPTAMTGGEDRYHMRWRVTLTHPYGESEIEGGSVAFTDRRIAVGQATIEGVSAFRRAIKRYDDADTGTTIRS